MVHEIVVVFLPALVLVAETCGAGVIAFIVKGIGIFRQGMLKLGKAGLTFMDIKVVALNAVLMRGLGGVTDGAFHLLARIM